jgi:hypothetical protein
MCLLDLGFSVAGVFLESWSPTRLPGDCDLCSVDCSSSEERRGVLDHGVLGEAKLHQEPGHRLELCSNSFLLLVRGGGFEKPDDEDVRGGHREVELERVEHVLLHGQDFVTRVGVVGDVDEVVHFGGPNLLVLGCQEHGGHAHQLQVLPGHALHAQVPVDEVGCQEQRLWHQLELQVHLNEPVDQNGAHLLVDVRLPRHVICWHAALNLSLTVKPVDILNVLHHRELVTSVMLVDVGNWLFGLVHIRIIHTTCNLYQKRKLVSSIQLPTSLQFRIETDLKVPTSPRCVQ